MMQGAMQVAAALGEAPAMVTPAEGNLCVFAHDALHPHHDKDVRSLVTFPCAQLKGLVVNGWLLDCWGQMKTVRLAPDNEDGDTGQIYILLHRMHARAVAPTPRQTSGVVHQPNKRITNFIIEAWERWLEEESRMKALSYPR